MRIHFITRSIQTAVLACLLLAVGCAKMSGLYGSPEPLPPSAQIGGTYYNQVGMYYEKGRYLTTNYSAGIFLPVNTPVQLSEYNRKSFVVTVQSTAEPIEVVNVEKYTHWSQAQTFEKLFAPGKVSLSKFSGTERKNIDAGSIDKGMRKDAVIVARGYPPSHETPSLKRDQWKYWKNRWNTIIVTFKNDRVVDIKD